MTATERLRELLDELNIKHFDCDKGGRTQTLWDAPDCNRHFTYETYDNPARTAKLVISWFPTPEQAIAATLGAGTCHVECFDDGIDEALDGSPIYTTPTWHLSCGHTEQGSERPNFCPVCGKVVDE